MNAQKKICAFLFISKTKKKQQEEHANFLKKLLKIVNY